MHLGSRWGVYALYVDKTPTGYSVEDMFDLDSDKEFRFKSESVARREADELNRLDVQGPLDPAFADRRNRLKRTAPDFGGWVHDGPDEARWPVRPKRYAVEMLYGGEDWWELGDDAAELKRIAREDEKTVLRIVDLDTGDEVSKRRLIIRYVAMALGRP